MLEAFGKRLRRRAGSALVENLFHGVARLGALHPRARPASHGVEVLRDLAYAPGGRTEHRLDVYRPAPATAMASGPRPVVLYVHGGGFRILSKETHWIMALAFARRGYVVFNMSYRLAPEHPFPAAVEDACAAYAWVARHAAEHGGDPSRLVLAGESAGANLVTSLALCAAYRRPEPWARSVWDTGVAPKAVVPACGIFQVSDPGRFQRRKPGLSTFLVDRLDEVSDAYLGAVTGSSAEALELADPLVTLERGDAPDRPLPPFFLPVGTADPLLDDTRRMERALRGLGVPCEARYYEGEMHAFHAFVLRKNARRCWQDTFAFLDRVLPAASGARVGAAAEAKAGEAGR